METSAFRNNKAGSEGFTLLETVLAIVVLSVGLLSVAELAAQMVSGTSRSHYSSLAADLASEKLEDLNRWPSFDPNVYASPLAGSLTGDTSANVTSGGIGPELVNYYDDVQLTDKSGAISETVSVVSGSTTSWKTTTHNPDGTITTSTSTSAPTGAGTIDFHRRWVIEMDQPVTGVRRITVLVTLEGTAGQAPVTFQMTTVRP